MADDTANWIGKYVIQAELGRGGFGRVYRAFDPTVGRLVAIKVLTAEGGKDLLTRFRNEAAAAGNLHHRNIVTIYEFGEHNGLPFIAMEFLEGEDLQQVIAKRSPLTLLEKVSIMVQVADGLYCAHRNGVVHRDVKPANIRLLPDGTIKIMDFGIARLIDDTMATRLTRQGHVIGTLQYMAPEQVMGADVDALCDIFAYGSIYYELLTGKHPFHAADPRAVFYQITSKDPDPIRSLAPECPDALEQVVRRALHKDRELRYQNLRDLQLDTEPILLELQQERAAALLAEATELAAKDDVDAAQTVLAEAANLDPASRAVRQLRETVQARLRRRLLQPRIDAFAAKAEAAIAEGKYTEAVESLEAALRLDPGNTAVQSGLAEARQRVERSRQAAQLVADARQALSHRDLAMALRKASEAIQLDDQSADARQLVDAVQQEIERQEAERRQELAAREKAQAVDRIRSEVLGLAEAMHFDRALDTVEKGLDAYAGESSLVELRETIVKAKSDWERRRTVEKTVARCESLRDQSRFREALDATEDVLRKYPGEPQLIEMRQRLERSDAVRQATEQSDALILRGDLAGAVAALEAALPEYPELSEHLARAQEALRTRQREDAVNEAVRKADELAAGQRFAEAMSAVEICLAKYPDEQRLRSAWDRHNREQAVRRATEQSEALIEQGDPAAAVAALEAALAEYPELGEQLARAQEALRTRQREDAVNEAVRKADELAAGQRFAEAVSAIETCLVKYPDEQRLRSTWGRHKRADAMRREIEQSDGLIEQGDPAGAVAALEAALAEYPELREHLARAQEALRARQREDAVNEAVRKADELAAGQRFAEAVNAVETCLAKYPDEQRLRSTWDRHKRADAMRLAIEQSDALIEHGDPAGAVAELDAALAEYPELGEHLARAQEALRARHREDAVNEAVRKADELAAGQRFAEAVSAVENCLAKYPDEQRLRSAWDRHNRERAVQQATESAEAAVRRGDPRNAIEGLTAASAQYPGEPAITAALARIRADSIGAAMRKAREALEARQFEPALHSIAEALEIHGPDGGLQALREEVLGQKAAWERSQFLDAAVERCELLRREGRFAEAVQDAARALEQYPGESRLTGLVRGLEADLRRERRATAVRGALADAQVRLDRGEPERAVEVLERAITRFSGEPDLESALARAGEAVKTRRRAQAIEAAATEARAHLDRNEFDRALQSIEGALATYAGDPDVQSLRELEKRIRLQRAINEAGSFAGAGQPARAVETLKAALARYPGEQQLASALARAEKDLRARERAEAVARASQAARARLENQEFDRAIQDLDTALRLYPGETALVELKASTLAAKQRWERDRQRRAESIRRAVESARGLIEQRQPSRAVDVLQAAAEQYPEEPALTTALARAENAVREQRRFEAVEAICRETREYVEAQDFDRALETVKQSLKTYAGERKLTKLQETVIAARSEWERRQRAGAEMARGAGSYQSAQAVTDEVQMPPPPTWEPPVLREPPAATPPPPLPQAVPAEPNNRRRAATAAAILALAGASIGIWRWLGNKGAPPLEIATTPPGAIVRANGQECRTPDCRLALPPGRHRIEVRLDGYEPLIETASVGGRDSASRLAFALKPLPSSVQVLTNFARGSVALDGAATRQLQEGQLTIDRVAPGRHQLTVSGPDGETAFAFTAAPAAMPVVEGSIRTERVNSAVVASFGGEARLLCSVCSGAVVVDRKPAGDLREGRIALTGLSEGTHELVLQDAVGQQRLVFRASKAPSLNVAVMSARDFGTAIVETGEDGATVFIDGKRYPRTTSGGQLLVQLEAADHLIRVAKQGYRAQPPEATARVRKGEQVRAVFSLKPEDSTLVIAGAPPDARVALDGRDVGVVRPGGSFTARVPPGEHNVGITKEGYLPLTTGRVFEAGGTVRLEGPAARLAPAPKPKAPEAPAAAEPPAAPRPDPAAIEAQQWEHIRGSDNPEDVQAFLRSHPDGAHAEQAHRRLEQLDWNATNKADRAALQSFLAKHPTGTFAQQAKDELGRMEKESQAESQRQNDVQRLAADRAAIREVLNNFAAAYEAKDANRIAELWPSYGQNRLRELRNQFKNFRSFRVELRPLGEPEIAGDRARVRCLYSTEAVDQAGPHVFQRNVTIGLARTSGRWLIESMQ